MIIHVISLGCDKNRTDTEAMLALLSEAGHIITDEADKAELILINTCCFIGDAKEESVKTIIEAGNMRDVAETPCRFVVVCGCLAQRYYYEMEESLPEADAVVGTTAFDRIADIVAELEEKGGRPGFISCIEPVDRLPAVKKRFLTTGGHYAYLKIAEGCDKRCTYCIIPYVRGRYRSYPMEELVSAAESMAANGVKELILVAQETDLYGTDLYGKKSLHTLLERLNDIEGLVWIRILYCYPEEIYDELIDAMKRLPKVVHYLDIPIQHASDEILSVMGRKTRRAAIEKNIARLRREIPDIVLRTTLITGFPGEKRKHFGELLEFVKKMRFERLGVFPFSREEGTPADEMPHQVPGTIARRRADIIMREQQDISLTANERLIGEYIKVVVTGYIPDMDLYVGRSYADVPDVDGGVFFSSSEPLVSGQFVVCLISEANDYDLIGEYYEPAE